MRELLHGRAIDGRDKNKVCEGRSRILTAAGMHRLKMIQQELR
jgi:hypothetical protein